MVKILQGSVVTQTMLGGLYLYIPRLQSCLSLRVFVCIKTAAKNPSFLKFWKSFSGYFYIN